MSHNETFGLKQYRKYRMVQKRKARRKFLDECYEKLQPASESGEVMEKFPQLVWSEILSLLTYKERAKLTQVNRTMNSVCSDFESSAAHATIFDLEKYFKSNRKIPPINYKSVKILCLNSDHLKYLHANKEQRYIFDLMTMPKLKSLYIIRVTSVEQFSWPAFCPNAPVFPIENLIYEETCLGGKRTARTKGVELAGMLRSFPNLKTIELRYLGINQLDLMEFLQQMGKIREIRLKGTMYTKFLLLTMAKLKQLEVLHICTKLDRLDESFDHQARILFQGLLSLPNLKELHISLLRGRIDLGNQLFRPHWQNLRITIHIDIYCLCIETIVYLIFLSQGFKQICLNSYNSYTTTDIDYRPLVDQFTKSCRIPWNL